MKKNRYLLKALLALVVFLLSFLLTLNYIASTLINLESVRSGFNRVITEKTGGTVEYEKIDLSIIPLTHAVIHKAKISIPGKARGTIERLNLHPSLLPLMTGRLEIDKVRLLSPDIRASLPAGPDKEIKESLTLEGINENLTSLIGSLLSELPEFDIRIKDGKISFSEKEEPPLKFDSLNGEIDSGSKRFRLDIKGRSEVFGAISAVTDINKKDLAGKGRVQLNNIKFKKVLNLFRENGTYPITTPIDEIVLNFRLNGPQGLEAEFRSDLPQLFFQKDDRQFVLRGKDIKVRFHTGKDKTSLSLSDMTLDYPRLGMTGELSIDHKNEQVGLELTGSDIDIFSAAEISDAFLDEDSVFNDIFEIMKGGTLPYFRFTSRGRSLNELGNTDNFIIKAVIDQGDIYVPEPDLDLKGVSGNVSVKEGILYGSNLDSRLGSATGRNGEIKIGLVDDGPLYVKTYIETGPSELPPIFRRLIDNEPFLGEIDLIENIDGTLKGTMLLEEQMDEIDLEVDVDEMDLSADYGRIPYHINIRSGKLSYNASGISVKDLYGTIGDSSFSEFTSSIGFGEDHYFEIVSGNALISLNEIYPWVISYENIAAELKNLNSAEGRINLSEMKLKGPLLSPDRWIFEASGEAEDLVIDAAGFPGVIEVETGRFSLSEKVFAFSDAEFGLLDSRLSMSGTIDSYFKKPDRTELEFNGEIGAEAVGWVYGLIDMPPELYVRPPLSVSETRLIMKSDATIALDGSFTVQSGPEVTIDILHNPETLFINNLVIEDERSRSVFSMALDETEMSLDFKGDLDQTTTEKILQNPLTYKGSGKGEFRAYISFERPQDSTVEGMFEGDGLVVPFEQKEPLIIDDISVASSDKRLDVNSMMVSWKDKKAALKGDIKSSDEGFLFNMAMSSDNLDWDTIRDALERPDREDLKDDKYFWNAPVKGNIILTSGRFGFDQFRLSGLEADISFDRTNIIAAITKADLCGISFPGLLDITPGHISIDLRLLGINEELNTTLACLGDDRGIITGKYNIVASVRTEKVNELTMKNLQGEVEIDARDGRIYRYGLLAKLFAFLNLSETFMGRFPDLTKEGFSYKSITAKGDIKGGVLMLNETIIDSPSMQITGRGNINLTNKEIYLKILVSPLRTADLIIKKTPIVKDILKGTLISIPVKIKGDLDDPEISYLDPGDVGSELLDIMKRTIKAPFKIIEPVIPIL